MVKRVLIALVLSAQFVFAQSAGTYLSSATDFQRLSDHDLQVVQAYALASMAFGSITAAGAVSNAVDFYRLSERDLQVVQAYALSQLQSGINTNQFTSSGVIKSGSFQTNNQFFATSSSVLVLSSGSNIIAQFTPIGGMFVPNGLLAGQLGVTNGGGANAILMNSDGTAVFGNSITSSNGFLAKSNVLASIPALVKGDTYYWSSNGVAYVICSSPTGVLTTNKLGP